MVTRIALAVLIITVALKELIHKQKMESNMQHYKLVFSKKKLPIRIDKSFKKKVISILSHQSYQKERFYIWCR